VYVVRKHDGKKWKFDPKTGRIGPSSNPRKYKRSRRAYVRNRRGRKGAYRRVAANSTVEELYPHIFARQRANDRKIARYVGRLKVNLNGETWTLVGVNDTGVLYWRRPGDEKKKYALGAGYYLRNLRELLKRWRR